MAVLQEEKSELSTLLVKNGCTLESLTTEETERAWHLILNPTYSGGNCTMCEIQSRFYPKTNIGKEIYDTRLCSGHALYCLNTKK